MSIVQKIKKNIRESEGISFPVGRKEFIRLDLNEGYGLLDNSILEKFTVNNFILSTYPEYEKLYDLLSEYLGVSSQNICLFNGSDQAIVSLLNLFVEKNEKIIIPTPTFVIYNYFAKIVGANAVEIPYILNDNELVFPLQKVLVEIDEKTKAIFLCNPNNPIGTPIPEDQLLKIIEKANGFDIPVIIDEAYYEYYGKTSVTKLREYENIIILRTFSKGFGLAGLRVGYVIANSLVIKELKKIKLPWNVNHVGVNFISTALKNISYFEQRRKLHIKIKKKLKDELERVAEIIYPSETNFLLCRFKDAKIIQENFRSSGILVNNTSKYIGCGTILENTLRISIPSEDACEKVLSAVQSMRP